MTSFVRANRDTASTRIALSLACAWSLAVLVPDAATSRAVQGDAVANIYVVNLQTGRMTRLTHAVDTFFDNAAWVPRGGHISFSGPSCDDCSTASFVVSRAGARPQRLRTRVLPADRPSWAPGGKRFVFVGGPKGAVYAVDSDGSHLKRLTHDRASHDEAVWSPNGTTIAYTTQARNGRWDLYTMDPSGRHVRRLTRTPASEEEPAWSPDSKKLAFTRQIKGHWSIWVIRADGRQSERVTRNRSDEESPAWSPDGRRLAFNRIVRSRVFLFVMNSRGGPARKVVTGLTRSYRPAFSPDGRELAFTGQP